MTNLLLNKYKMQICFVLLEEELDNIGTQMTISPMIHLSCLAA